MPSQTHPNQFLQLRLRLPLTLFILALNNMKVKLTEETIDEVFDLFKTHGNHMYVGEVINQTSHAIQSAMLAEKHNKPPAVSN